MKFLFLSFALHLIAIFLLVNGSEEPKMPARHQIKERTFVEKQAFHPVASTAAAKISKSTDQKPKPSALPALKKTEVPGEKKKSAAPKKKEEPANARSEQIAALLNQSLNLLKSDTLAPNKAPVEAALLPQLECETLGPVLTYEEELVFYLEEKLCLPESGSVKLALTLSRDGALQKLEFLQSASLKNRLYVEQALATLCFTPFKHHYKGEKNKTFTITLTSE